MPTLACMFQRARKASSGLERLSRAEVDVSHAASPRIGQIEDWRDAAKREARAYKAWCAGRPHDRHCLYALFLDALRCEEIAARRIEHDASVLGAADPTR